MQRSADHKRYLRLLWLLPGPVFYALFRLSFLWPNVTETVYSRGIFIALGQALSTVTGLLPFSLAELLLYAFALFVAVYTVWSVIKTIRAKKDWWRTLLWRIAVLGCVVSTIYALFVGLWGFNYARQPLDKTLGLDASPATVEELYATCQALIERADVLRAKVPEDAQGLFDPDFSRQDMMAGVAGLYDEAARITDHAFLSGSYGPAKPVLYSTGLSYADITGVYFPFTGEANVNTDVPMLLFPASCLHEAAHQRGFAREDEANFLAYYVSSYASDISVCYSGTMLALIHAMNKLYTENSALYFDLRPQYSPGLVRDLQNNAQYWQQFESPVNAAAQSVNNTFLQANQQHDGVKSYGRMVDLLIGLWRSGGISTPAEYSA